MEKFYLTFGQRSEYKDGWFLIIAKDYLAARELAHEKFGNNWSMLYFDDEFEPGFFPNGEIDILRN